MRGIRSRVGLKLAFAARFSFLFVTFPFSIFYSLACIAWEFFSFCFKLFIGFSPPFFFLFENVSFVT